jgi:hypothetical protein
VVLALAFSILAVGLLGSVLSLCASQSGVGLSLFAPRQTASMRWWCRKGALTQNETDYATDTSKAVSLLGEYSMPVSRRSLAFWVTLSMLILCSGCATHHWPAATIPAGPSVAHISGPSAIPAGPSVGTKHFARVP